MNKWEILPFSLFFFNGINSLSTYPRRISWIFLLQCSLIQFLWMAKYFLTLLSAINYHLRIDRHRKRHSTLYKFVKEGIFFYDVALLNKTAKLYPAITSTSRLIFISIETKTSWKIVVQRLRLSHDDDGDTDSPRRGLTHSKSIPYRNKGKIHLERWIWMQVCFLFAG